MEIARYSRNENGRDFIIGDIHGRFTKVQAELTRIGFDVACDRLFSVGDICDRGAESEECVDWINKPWFIPIRGNHEQMIIDACDGWYDHEQFRLNGASWWMDLPNDEHKRYYGDAFNKLPFAIELDTAAGKIGIVHAECPSHDWITFCTRLEHETDHMPGGLFLSTMKNCAIWSRDRLSKMDDAMITNIRAVVSGHSGTEKHTILGNSHFIDTYYESGVFTLLNAETLEPV